MADRPIHCSIKNSVTLTVADHKSEFHTGCRVVDINFPNVTTPENASVLSMCDRIGEIHFKNYYVALLTVRIKQKYIPEPGTTEPTPDIKWRTCLKRMRLMPNPHCEAGSQDYFCVSKNRFLFELTNVTAMRLILQQPSPVWKDFKLEDIKLYRNAEVNRPPPLPSWLLEEQNNTNRRKIEGVPNLDAISATLQQLWALSEEVAASQTNQAIGRYDVDGCYEINLLSYS